MKEVFYLQTEHINDGELTDLLQYLAVLKKGKVVPTPHCIETRVMSGNWLLMAVMENTSLQIDLYRYEHLSGMMKEGYKSHSAFDRYEFFSELAEGKYKWC